ncbi:MAG: nitrogen regulatory protein 1 [Clostridia bacterium]|nr:nitrogen regulatory protein 1 [Clostridia bacterium]
MKKVEAIVRASKFEEVKDALAQLDIKGMTVTHVLGCGHQGGKTNVYRGSEYTVDLLPKVKVEIVTKDHMVDDLISVISKAAKTDKIGDGKIFVYSIDNVVRIRTGEINEKAL